MAKAKGRGDGPAKEKLHDELRMLAERHGAAAIEQLLRLALSANSESVQVAALRELLERGFGRVPAAAGSGDGNAPRYLIIDDGYDT